MQTTTPLKNMSTTTNCWLALQPILTLRTPLPSVMCILLTPSSQIANTGHDLSTREGQTNGFLVFPIFSMHIMAAQAQPDVTSLHSTRTLACVQVVYSGYLSNEVKCVYCPIDTCIHNYICNKPVKVSSCKLKCPFSSLCACSISSENQRSVLLPLCQPCSQGWSWHHWASC